jgi:hypothetical protein
MPVQELARRASVVLAFLLLSACAGTKVGPRTLTVDLHTYGQLADRSDLAAVVDLEFVGEIPAEVLASVAPRLTSLRSFRWRDHAGLTAAHLVALRQVPIEALQLVDAQVQERHLLAGLAGHEHLSRMAFLQVQGLRPEVIDDLMRLPNLAELDLSGLPGLGRFGSDAHLGAWTELFLLHLADRGAAPPTQCRLRLSGENSTPWRELVRLAQLRSAKLDLTGKIDASLIPRIEVGSSFSKDAQRLGEAKSIVAIDAMLQARFELLAP